MHDRCKFRHELGFRTCVQFSKLKQAMGITHMGLRIYIVYVDITETFCTFGSASIIF